MCDLWRAFSRFYEGCKRNSFYKGFSRGLGTITALAFSMHFFSLIVISLILFVWIIQALIQLKGQKFLSIGMLITYVSSGCMILGVIAFMAPALISLGFIEIKHDFEWPIGHSNQALKLSNGDIAVAHEPAGRIQIYDENLNFKTGMNIEDNGGGMLNLIVNEIDELVVVAARADTKSTYALDGTLLNLEIYENRVPWDKSHLQRVNIPTPFYLWAFTHPIKAWVLAFLGLLLSSIVRKIASNHSVE